MSAPRSDAATVRATLDLLKRRGNTMPPAPPATSNRRRRTGGRGDAGLLSASVLPTAVFAGQGDLDATDPDFPRSQR